MRFPILTVSILLLIPSKQLHAQSQGNKASEPELQRVMETPMEPLLPCSAEDELIVYTLKEPDGKNIQVAIECRAGKLTAKYPQAPAPEIEVEVESPAP